MLTPTYISEHREKVIDLLKVKNFDAEELVEQVIDLNEERKRLQQLNDSKQNELNNISKEIGQLFKDGKKEEAEKSKRQTTIIKDEIKDISQKYNESQKNLESILIQIPNVPHPSVPKGKSGDDNELIRSGGEIPKLSEKIPHWELAKKYNLIDFELGNKLTGAGFPVYIDKGSKLQRALINFFLDENEKAGYKEVLPPFMVNENSAFATGQLPDKEGQMYAVPIDNFYLVPTAEVPVTNIFRDVILEDNDFPVKLTAYTPCFRREAGSYGKDVRGLNRVHQFDKVEIVQIQKPENSYKALEDMVNHVEKIVKKLGIPYRIVKLSGGDISFHSALTYDFEVFSAAQEKWLEVSSVSNFESFQANRLKLRYRDKNSKKTQLVHTLNGSSLALPRIVAALLENNQRENIIIIPEALRKYTGFDKIS